MLKIFGVALLLCIVIYWGVTGHVNIFCVTIAGVTTGVGQIVQVVQEERNIPVEQRIPTQDMRLARYEEGW